MKYLIAGLGNIGDEYYQTRHNVGFMILDHLAEKEGHTFSTARYGAVTKFRLKNKWVYLLKPSTFMNLSGQAIRYWLQKEKIPVENLLVITDDIFLDTGKIRLRGKGSDGGHNGLKNIQECLNSTKYARMRFGVGQEYSKGQQVQYVLGKFPSSEINELLPPYFDLALLGITDFVLQGLSAAMNKVNNKKLDL